MAKTKTIKKDNQQKAYVVLRDGEFHRAFPMRVLAEGYRRSVLPGSKHEWTIRRGILSTRTIDK